MRMISRLVYFSPAIAYFLVVCVQTVILYWMSAEMEIVFLILIGLMMGGATMLLVISLEGEERKRRLQDAVDRIKKDYPDATIYASETAMIYPRTEAQFKKDFEASWDGSEDSDDMWDLEKEAWKRLGEEESETDEPSVEMPTHRLDRDVS